MPSGLQVQWGGATAPCAPSLCMGLMYVMYEAALYMVPDLPIDVVPHLIIPMLHVVLFPGSTSTLSDRILSVHAEILTK